jgi:hypothetical protein
MKSDCRTIALSLLLCLSCSEESIRSVHSFQPAAPVRVPLHLHQCTQIQTQNLNQRQKLKRNQRKKYSAFESRPGTGIRTSSSLFSSSNSVGPDEKGSVEKSTSTKLLQDQSIENPLSSFISSIPSFDIPNFFSDDEDQRLKKRDLIRSLFRRLANLSLQDYYWRSDLFKKTEADRRVEESLARMMGEDPAYVRPMDAGDKMGPLGKAEKQLVDWLSLVIEEEGRRARLISSSDGKLVRPIDLQETDVGGPLAALEDTAIKFLGSIRASEKERVRTLTLRPKDVEIEKRGPLGNFEAKVVNALDEIRKSEELRMEQSRQRGGEIVRPIDVPGPLGEAERWYLDLITSEKQRGKDRDKNDGKLVRPKDASIEGPMGAAERQFSNAMTVVRNEETERLKNIKRVLEENRPMERDRQSVVGFTEAFLVGVFRAPQLIFRVVDRVKELLESEKLNEKDNITKTRK